MTPAHPDPDDCLATESGRWFRRLIESSGDLVLTWTQEGTITYASPAAQSIWGAREGAAVTDLIDRVHADDQANTRENLERAENVPGPLRFDNRIVSPSNAEHRILWNVSAVRDRSGKLTHLQGIGHDVTEWYDLEQRLKGAQYSESVVRLARGFAHEFNNMLVSVLGNATVLLGQVQPDHHWYPILSDIIDGAERAARLTRQLLTYARATSYTPQRRRLGDLLNEHLELNRTVVPPVIDLRVHLDAEDDWIEADPMQLQQVVIGLISNAVEAMPDGGTVTVRTSRVDAAGSSGRAAPGWLLLSVEDMGVGIPPEDRERIFDPFFSTKEMGRGLGLAAIQGIVQAHRGKIEIESRPGWGTKARVYLPPA